MLRSGVHRLRRAALPVARRLRRRRYQTEPWAPEKWHWGYSSGHLDYFAGLDELPRYSLLIGYLGFLGGEPDILDVGCGQGLLRARIGALPFRRYVGIDGSPTAVDLAQRLADDRTTFVAGDVCRPTTDLGQFDVVVCNEVLSVAPDAEAMLDRVAELLRADGHLLVSTWRHPGDEALHRLIDRRFPPIDVVHAQNPANPIAPRGWRVSCHRR